MGGHEHGHAPRDPYKVQPPDFYKIENAPELIKYRDQLAKQGLKDPWIRNHIWRFDKRYGTVWSRAGVMFFRGIPTGVAAFGLTLAIENYFGINWHPYLHDHGDSSGHEKGHH